MDNVIGLFFRHGLIFNIIKADKDYDVYTIDIKTRDSNFYKSINKGTVDNLLKFAIKIDRDTMQGIILGIFDEDY